MTREGEECCIRNIGQRLVRRSLEIQGGENPGRQTSEDFCGLFGLRGSRCSGSIWLILSYGLASFRNPWWLIPSFWCNADFGACSQKQSFAFIRGIQRDCTSELSFDINREEPTNPKSYSGSPEDPDINLLTNIRNPDLREKIRLHMRSMCFLRAISINKKTTRLSSSRGSPNRRRSEVPRQRIWHSQDRARDRFQPFKPG